MKDDRSWQEKLAELEKIEMDVGYDTPCLVLKRSPLTRPSLNHKLVSRLILGIDRAGHLVVAMHACDYPPCIREDHLVIGTHSENIRDRIRRGRSRWDLKNR